MATVSSVSYTHLDVYKRQGQLPVEVSDHQALHCKDFRVGLSGADQLFQPLGFGKGIVVEQHHIFLSLIHI